MTRPGDDALLARVNLVLEPLGETLRQSRTAREIGMHGRWYTVDHLGRVLQTDVSIVTLAAELGVVRLILDTPFIVAPCAQTENPK